MDRELPKFISRLHDFMGALWLVGSDDVMKAVLHWRQFSQDADASNESGATALVALADIMIAMRKDLGDTETQIEARDILGTFINDIDKVMPRRR